MSLHFQMWKLFFVVSQHIQKWKFMPGKNSHLSIILHSIENLSTLYFKIGCFMTQLLPKLLVEQHLVWYFHRFLGIVSVRGYSPELPCSQTENRVHKGCRNKRLLIPSPCHMPTFFFLYIDVKIFNCFFLFKTFLFFPMAWRCVSKIEYFMHVSEAFHDQEFKRKMRTETGKSTLGGNNSNVTH